MKLIYNNSLILLFIIFLTIRPELALTDNSSKLVSISSTNQTLNMKNNIAIFTGNVIIIKGSIKIIAEEATVTRTGKDKNSIVEAFGNPAIFYQLKDNNIPVVKGQAQKMHYEIEKGFVELIGNAYVEKTDSDIKGNRITYLVKEKKIEAFSDNKNKQRVVVTFLPSKLKVKSN